MELTLFADCRGTYMWKTNDFISRDEFKTFFYDHLMTKTIDEDIATSLAELIHSGLSIEEHQLRFEDQRRLHRKVDEPALDIP
jgi:hypothetical protein